MGRGSAAGGTPFPPRSPASGRPMRSMKRNLVGTSPRRPPTSPSPMWTTSSSGSARALTRAAVAGASLPTPRPWAAARRTAAERVAKATHRLQVAQEGMVHDQHLRDRDLGKVHRYAQPLHGQSVGFSHTRGTGGEPAHGLGIRTTPAPAVNVTRSTVFFPSVQTRSSSRGRGRRK